jgi:hypothetical protein
MNFGLRPNARHAGPGEILTFWLAQTSTLSVLCQEIKYDYVRCRSQERVAARNRKFGLLFSQTNFVLQIIRETAKQRTDDGYILAETRSLSNTTDISKSEKCSGNVSVNKGQCIRYETNKRITIWKDASQKWSLC